MKNSELPSFSRASVLVIGDIMLDRYWFGDAKRISPEAPVPIVNIKQATDKPGGAGNVALNVAALGAQVQLLGITGKDESARTLLEQLAAANIVTDIQQYHHFPTITKLRVISQRQQLLRLDFEEKSMAFDPENLLSAYKKALNNCNLVILSDYHKGTLSDPQIFIRLACAANIPVLVDPKGGDFSIYQGANIITPNLKEFENIVGPSATEQELITKGVTFLQTHQIDALLLTRGDRGMTLIQRDQEEFHLPAHAREVFDVTGAGDTVIATLGTALAAGIDLPTATQLANLAASIVVGKLGASAVSAPELTAAFSNKSIGTRGVLTEDQLLIAVNHARLSGKKIVFTNGCFDILHAGHVTYLQQAKQLGDLLIVAVNDDASIARLKGPGRPVNSINQRMAVLAGLDAVDWVVSFADDTPKRLLQLLQPDMLAKGGDYTIDHVVGAEIVRAYGGDIRVLGMIKNLSTTSIIDRAVQSVKLVEESAE